ncbi:MAG: hypothetical protein AAGA59_18100 [Actinomycetota bacterium]
MIACICGVESRPAAHFCRSCGRPLEPGPVDGVTAVPSGAAAGAAGEPGLGLLDGSIDPVEQTSRVVKGGDEGGRLSLLIGSAVLGLVAVVGLLFAAGGRATDEPAGAADGAADGADEAIAEEGAASDDDEDGDGAPTDGAADDDVAAGEAPTGTTSSTISPEAYDFDNRAIESAARFGREVSYRLVISTTGGLATFNANNGEIVYYERSDSLLPVATADGWLIAQTAESPSLVRLPLDDLSAPSQTLIPEGVLAALPGTSAVEGLLLVQSWSSEVSRPVALDVASGQEVTHPLFDRDEIEVGFWGGSVLLGLDAGAFTAPSGGVYVVDADGIGQISPGRLVAGDTERVLVEQCDERFRCEPSWVDPQGRPLDLAVPDNDADFGAFVNGTDWLATTTFTFGSEELIWHLVDVERGLHRETTDNPQFNSFATGAVPAISPDGRWLAEVGDFGTSIVLTNLTVDSAVEIELDERVTNGLLYTDE